MATPFKRSNESHGRQANCQVELRQQVVGYIPLPTAPYPTGLERCRRTNPTKTLELWQVVDLQDSIRRRT